MKRAPAGNASALGAYVPPNSIEAEQSTLGAMLIDNNCIDIIDEYLERGDFYRETHQTLFDVAVQLRRKGSPVDLITVMEELKNRDKLDAIGGVSYLTSLFETVPTAVNALHYAKIVLDKSTLRRYIAACLEGIGIARGEVSDISEVADRIERSIFAVSARRRRGVGPVHIKELIQRAVPNSKDSEAEDEEIAEAAVRLGIKALDKRVKARPGRLIIIGARPSVGKTSLALAVALNVARAGKPVIFFSLELPADEVILKLVATCAEVNFDKLADGDLSEEEWSRVQAAVNEIYELPFYVDDSTSSVSGVRAVCRQMAASEDGLGAFFVDYLQLMQMPRRFEKTVEAINWTCKELKDCGKDLGCPVFLLSQLNRGSERREGENKRPTKSDLREGGEEPADIILLIHRPEMHHAKVAGDSNKAGYVEPADIIIDKQRNGWTGAVRIGFKADFAEFLELDDYDWQFDDEAPTGF